MKKLNKNTAIIVSIALAIVMVLGILFCYVPITSGASRFLSLSGAVKVSADMTGGVYGEYDIVTENPTTEELVNSMEKVKKVFEENGYKNVNVYTIGKSKLRVEVGYPRGSKSYADAYSDLSVVAGGAFFLSNAYEADKEDAVIVNGHECVEKVKVFTNNDTKYVSVIFNEKGQEAYEKLISAASGSIYMHLGSYSQQISVSGVQDYTAFTLSDDDYSSLVSLEQRIVIGCMDIEINEKTAIIETMSSNLFAGSSSPEEKGFSAGLVMIMMLTTLAIFVVALIALFAVKFGLFAVVVALSMIFNSFIFLIFICLIPSIEIGISGIISLILGMALIYTYTFIFASTVKSEYNLGKSFSAALESAYKKSLPTVIITNIALFISALILFAFSFGELTSVTIIFAICTGIGLFTNLLFVPLLVKVGISFKKIGTNLFMLPKRAISFDAAEEIEAKEEV